MSRDETQSSMFQNWEFRENNKETIKISKRICYFGKLVGSTEGLFKITWKSDTKVIE